MKNDEWEDIKEKCRMGVLYGLFKSIPKEMAEAFAKGEEELFFKELETKLERKESLS